MLSDDTQIKGYPFEVRAAGREPGAALADRIKRLDWRARSAKRKGRVSHDVLDEVRVKIRALIGA